MKFSTSLLLSVAINGLLVSALVPDRSFKLSRRGRAVNSFRDQQLTSTIVRRAILHRALQRRHQDVWGHPHPSQEHVDHANNHYLAHNQAHRDHTGTIQPGPHPGYSTGQDIHSHVDVLGNPHHTEAEKNNANEYYKSTGQAHQDEHGNLQAGPDPRGNHQKNHNSQDVRVSQYFRGVFPLDAHGNFHATGKDAARTDSQHALQGISFIDYHGRGHPTEEARNAANVYYGVRHPSP